MGAKLANIDGRAALVRAEYFYDVENMTSGKLSSEPMAALDTLPQLPALDAWYAAKPPTGLLSDIELAAPVPRPGNVYAVSLNYRDHAQQSTMASPPMRMVFAKHSACICVPTADI